MEEEDDEPRHFVLLGGLGPVITTTSALSIAVTARYELGDDHAFVVGPRAHLAFFEPGAVGIIGADVGYRGLFGSGHLRGGLLAVAQPQIWAGGGGDALLSLGAAVGPVLRWNRVEIELPISVARLGPANEPFGHSRFNAAAFTVTLEGGVTF